MHIVGESYRVKERVHRNEIYEDRGETCARGAFFRWKYTEPERRVEKRGSTVNTHGMCTVHSVHGPDARDKRTRGDTTSLKNA